MIVFIDASISLFTSFHIWTFGTSKITLMFVYCKYSGIWCKYSGLWGDRVPPLSINFRIQTSTDILWSKNMCRTEIYIPFDVNIPIHVQYTWGDIWESKGTTHGHILGLLWAFSIFCLCLHGCICNWIIVNIQVMKKLFRASSLSLSKS